MEYLSRCDLCKSEDLVHYQADNICKCRACGYIFCNPRFVFSEIRKFYSDSGKYSSWLKHEKGRDILWQKRLAMVKRYKKEGALLDVGAGVGQFLFFAGNDFEISGTEISESAIKISQEKYNVHLIKGLLDDIDFGAQRFDVITLFHVLEHVHSPSLVIEKCFRLLNEDGIMVIAVPNEINSLMSFIKRPAKYLLSLLPFHKNSKYGVYGLKNIELNGSLDEIHLSYFTTKSLKRLLLNNHCTIIDDTLDPCYSSTGILRRVDDLFYLASGIVKKIFMINIYETIWIAVKRS